MSERAWCEELCSRVNQSDVSALTYDESEHQQLASYRSRFAAQPVIRDVDLGRMLDELAAYLNCKLPTPRQMAHYFKEMGTWPSVIVDLAFDRARRNWTFPKFPLVGDFHRWIQDELKERAEFINDLAAADGRLRLPRRQAQAEKELAERRTVAAKKADSWLLSLSPAEREEAVRRHLKSDQADRLLKRLADLEAADR